VTPAGASADVLSAVQDALERVDVAVDADEARVDRPRALGRVGRRGQADGGRQDGDPD
jgi:hypothetical protein